MLANNVPREEDTHKRMSKKNIRQKLSNDSDTEEQYNTTVNERGTVGKRTMVFGNRRKRFHKKAAGLAAVHETKHKAKTAAILIEEDKKELEDEWFQHNSKQLANVSSSLMEQTLWFEKDQPKPEYSMETIEELKRQTFGFQEEGGGGGGHNEKSRDITGETEESMDSSDHIQHNNRNNYKETLQDASLGEEQGMEIDNDDEEIDSESEALWELDQLRRASGNNKYTRKLERISNKKMESFQTPEILQEPLVVLEKVTKGLENALQSNEEEMSKILQQQTEKEKELDNCQKQLKEKETQILEASEKYSFYEKLGQYFDDLLDMLHDKWQPLEHLREWQDKVYQEYERNEILHRIFTLEDDELRLLPRTEEELLESVQEFHHLQQVTDSIGLEKELASIAQSRDALFQDVEWDYASVSQVVAHFVWWRKNYSKDFEEAYGELLLSKLLTEYTRIELLGCWPFGLESLKSLQSIQALEFYHREFGEPWSQSSCLKSILEEAILPSVSKWVRHLYFYPNVSETKKITIWRKELLNWSKDFEQLVLEKMNEAFLEKANDILEQLADHNTVWKSEQQERWNAYIYIVCMISYWHRWIAWEKKPLEQFVLDKIITGHILPNIRQLPPEDIVDRLYFVICRCLPQDWPDMYSSCWLAVRALVSRLVKETEKQNELEACKKRCGY